MFILIDQGTTTTQAAGPCGVLAHNHRIKVPGAYKRILMSGYQYYEFQAIDRPLAEDQEAEISALSSRAYVTSRVASFVYHYGDFRGNTEKLISDYFDAMLYMSNWGSRRLMFRIPCSLIDMNQVRFYCVSEEIEGRKTKDKANVILDFNFFD